MFSSICMRCGVRRCEIKIKELNVQSVHRIRGKATTGQKIVFHQEDVKLVGTGSRVRLRAFDERIQRTDKAQDDDLKQIVPFCILGLIYCFTHPAPVYARTIFQLFTAARFCYSFVYVIYIVRQPARAFAWSIGTLLNMYMCFKIFFYFM